MGAFGDENERGSGGFIGPFGWGGELTPAAQEARAKHAQFDEAEQNALGAVQDEIAKGHSMGQALANVARSQPDALHTLMLGGHLKDLATFQQLVNPGDSGKGFNLSPGQSRYDASGNKIAENPIQPGTITRDENGNYITMSSRGNPGVHMLPQGQTSEGQAATQARTNNLNARTGQILNPAGKPTKALNTQEEGMVNGLSTILTNVDKLQKSVSSTGSMGYGAIERGIAMHTPLSAPQAQVYNQAYNEIASAIPALSGSSRLKMVAEAIMQRLPKPSEANAFNVNQAIPGLGQSARQAVGDLYQTWKEEGKSTATLTQLGKTYEAGPNYMNMLRDARHALNSNPGQMTDDQVNILRNEQENKRLPWDESTAVMKQAVQRGMVSPDAWKKQVAAHPELNDIQDNERVANPRPWQDPNAQAQPIPATGSSAQPTQGQKTSVPAQGQGQGQPAPGGAPSGPPTTSDQQSQLPQQIQQTQSQMAPPGGVNPTGLQPDQAELQRQQQAKQLIEQSKQMADPNYVPGQGF